MKKNKLIFKILKYVFIVALLLLPFLCLLHLWGIGRNLGYYAPIDDQAFGTYGDFVGGVIGTICAAIAVFYAVKTYIEDRKKSKKTKIENHFYVMLAKHNEYTYYLKKEEENYFAKNIELLKEILDSNKNHLNVRNPKGKLLSLSYFYFFYGSKLQSDIMPNKQNIINKMNAYFHNNNIHFEGVSRNLGVYFRQLYQIVTYINKQQILSYHEKYNYIKSLRATLCNDAQYLLYLNSLSTLGNVWEIEENEKNNKLITKYNLIKNIPQNYLRILGDDDFENTYPNILYEYNRSQEAKTRREEWEKDYL